MIWRWRYNVSDLSRLARNVLDQGQTIVELTEMGIELISVDEPNLDDSAAGRLLKNVLGSMNQFFSDSLSEKTKVRMAAGVKAGRWLWVAPLGYINHTHTNTVVIDPDRAPLIRKAFELLSEGSYISDVIRQVTALGLTTRKGRKVSKQTFSRLSGWIPKENGTRVSVSAEELETRLHWLFIAIQPEAHLLAKLPTLLPELGNPQGMHCGRFKEPCLRRLEDQQALNRQTIEARVPGTLNDSDFQMMKVSIDAEITRIQEQIRALDSEVCTMEELVAQTEREVINFGQSWKQANARRKREIQSALFPEGLVYDQNQFFLNRFNRALVIDFTKEIDPQYVVDDCLSLIGVPDGI